MTTKQINMRILFPSDLTISPDAEGTPALTLGIEGMAITDLFQSGCSRFEADPEKDYGVPDDFARAMGIINMHLRQWAQDELDPVKKLARAFSARINNDLDPYEIVEVIMRNRSEPESQVCHTHDFVDANMIMAEACRDIGLDPEEAFGDAQSDISETWSAAWALAKKLEFNHY